MGQLITVTVRPGASPSVRMFDTNRSLTGMAIKFTEFEAQTEHVLGLGLTRMRILH